MYLGRVVGNVVSTSKNPELVGFKLLIVQKLDEYQKPTGSTEICVDDVGAGNGEVVIVTTGSSARHIFDGERSANPVDAAIVGIVDTVEVA